MPSPYFSGGTRPPGPPHNLIFGLERPGGPPHNLIFGIDYALECPPDWENVPGNDVDANFAHCVDIPGGDWENVPGNDVDIDFDCCDGGPEAVNVGPFEGATGEEFASVLSLQQQFSLNISVGETAQNFTLTTFPVVLMSANVYEGATKTVSIRTEMVVPVDFVAGEVLSSFTLTTFPAVDLGVVGNHEGGTLSASLLKFTYTDHIYQDGATAAVDVETDPYEGLVPEGFHGETLDATLQVVSLLQPRAYEGGTATVGNLSTDYYLDVSYRTGETLIVDFSNNPPWNPGIDFGVGETLITTLSLGAFSLGVILGYEGATLAPTLTDRPAATFTFTMSEGATASLAMSFAANLGDIIARDGATLVPETLEFDEIWRFHEGGRLEVTMSTVDTIRPFAYEGTRLEIDLTTGPSQGIGTLRGYEGAAATVDALAGLVAVNLAVNFTDSYVFLAGLPYIGTYFDLDTSCCTNHFPGQQDNHDIEMNLAPFPDEHYDGERIDIDIDLSTNVRFQFNCFTGETARTVDTIPYILGANMADGASMSVGLETVLNFRLCPGNFIPDGDNVYVELEFTDTEECESNFAYTGERMDVVSLQVFQNFQPRMTEGQNMVFTLTIPEVAFGARAYTGEVMLMPIEFGGAMYEGARAFFSFYEAPVLGYTGEAAAVDVVIKYDVRFLEVGCLDNEYIYQDENGDPVPEKFNPVPVELDPYQHDLKALCF